jgi:hypothetical protein
MGRACKEKNPNSLYITHISVLLAGLLVGLFAAYHIIALDFNFSAELKQAKELGINSYTVVHNYAKSKDILAYVVLLVVPVLSATGAWLVWARRKKKAGMRMLFLAEETVLPGGDMAWLICLAGVIFVYLTCAWNINYFYRANGLWELLGEEGENLAWAHAVLAGGVYGRDFFCLYGPLMVYPLAWAMELFGTTIITERAYTLCLNLAAYGIIICFLYSACRGRTTFMMSAFAYLLIFCPLYFLSPNCSYLRVALGMLPLLCAYHYLHSGKKALLIASGGAISLSLLFSQEAGICSGAAVVCCMILHAAAANDYKKLPGKMILIACGGAATLAPMMIYFFVKDAMGPVFAMLYNYPKLAALGSANLPIPSFATFLAAPLKEESLLYYGIIGVYACSAAFLMPLLLTGRLTRENILTASLLVFGALLFRSALGRSDQYHVYYVSQPAFLLMFLAFDRAVAGVRKRLPISARAGNALVSAGLLLFIFLLFNHSHNLRSSFHSVVQDIRHFSKKWTRDMNGVEVRSLTRGPILFEPVTAAAIEKIQAFLDSHSAPGDYVYFFPNEAAYYFLFNRANPTRYAYAWWAITTEYRRELAADLEKNKPRYIIYSLNTWRYDGLAEEQMVPEVVSYIRQRYRQVRDMGSFLILQRNDGV